MGARMVLPVPVPVPVPDWAEMARGARRAGLLRGGTAQDLGRAWAGGRVAFLAAPRSGLVDGDGRACMVRLARARLGLCATLVGLKGHGVVALSPVELLADLRAQDCAATVGKMLSSDVAWGSFCASIAAACGPVIVPAVPGWAACAATRSIAFCALEANEPVFMLEVAR